MICTNVTQVCKVFCSGYIKKGLVSATKCQRCGKYYSKSKEMDDNKKCVRDLLGQLKLSFHEFELEMDRIFSQPTVEPKKDSPPSTTEATEVPDIFLDLERRLKLLSTSQQAKGNVSNEEKSTENFSGPPTKRDSTGCFSKAEKQIDAGEISGSDSSTGKPAEDEDGSSPKKRSKKSCK